MEKVSRESGGVDGGWGVGGGDFWLVGCLLACSMSKQHASVSQGQVYSHNGVHLFTEIEDKEEERGV